MAYANIYAPMAESVGGVVGKAATSTLISACAFDGNIEAGGEAGGIVSESSADDKIVNCHVTVDIWGKGTVGGVVGTSERSKVANCYVEGTIELAENAEVAKVGGVIGAMGSTLSDTVYALVANNIVALEEMILPMEAELYAHRVVGYSNGDSFEYDWDNLDSSKPKDEKSAKRLSHAEREQLIARLTREMKNAAKLLEFEHAAYLRDRIEQLRSGK